jgi:hypothetical protein
MAFPFVDDEFIGRAATRQAQAGAGFPADRRGICEFPARPGNNL